MGVYKLVKKALRPVIEKLGKGCKWTVGCKIK